MGEHYLLMRPESAAPGNTSDTGSPMIEEDVMMSGPSAQPRILFVTPEVVFMPEGTGNSTDYINTHIEGFGDLLAGLISDLFDLARCLCGSAGLPQNFRRPFPEQQLDRGEEDPWRSGSSNQRQGIFLLQLPPFKFSMGKHQDFFSVSAGSHQSCHPGSSAGSDPLSRLDDRFDSGYGKEI